MPGICSVCQKNQNTIYRNKKSGLLVCSTCSKKDPSKHVKCIKCNKKGSVAQRTENNKPICRSCYQKEYAKNNIVFGKCVECKKRRKLIKKVDQGALCFVCYRADPASHKECFVCHKVNSVQVNTDDGPICHACYEIRRQSNKDKHKTCCLCQEVRTVVARISDQPCCERCWNQLKRFST